MNSQIYALALPFGTLLVLDPSLATIGNMRMIKVQKRANVVFSLFSGLDLQVFAYSQDGEREEARCVQIDYMKARRGEFTETLKTGRPSDMVSRICE